MSDRPARGNGTADAARLLHAAARERLAVALADLFLPDSLNLSEQHRATMGALLARLVRSIEDELRASLAGAFDEVRHPAVHAALASVRVELALPILSSSEALRDPDLISLLLRRVEEHRIHRAAESASPASENGLFSDLVRDKDQAIAKAAMAALIAQSRRFDRFQEPMIASPELPAEIEHRLVWTVAAALRVYLVTRQKVDPAKADQAIAAAAEARLSAYDEGEGLEARSIQLARLLHGSARLDDALIARFLAEGHLLLLHAALAVRCRLSLEAVWEVLSDPRGDGPALLLRAADLGRETAGTVLLALAGGATVADPDALVARQLGLFDRVSCAEANDAISLWTVDAAYRAAVGRVSSRRRGAATA